MNLATLGERNLERFGEYTAILFEGRRITNAEQLGESRRLASALVAAGVRDGDRVGVLLPNMPEVSACYGAINRMGGIVVPMLFLLAPAEIRHIAQDSAMRAVVTSPAFYPNVAAAIDGLDAPPVVIVAGGPAPEGALSYADIVAGAPEHPVAPKDESDLAVIVYTSGTTGRPKGVALTHGNLLFNAENTSTVVSLRDGDVSLACLPLAHLFGLGSAVVASLFKVTGVILPWFTPEGFFEAVRAHRVTQSAVVPAMLTIMLADPGFDDVDWSSLRYVVVGAAPVPLEVAEEFERRTGARVLEGYGLSETSPTVSVVRMEDEPRPGSCGRPVPNVDVAVVDDDGRPVPAGELGEVCVRGPNVMDGYYNMPDATAEVMRDGWFHTGDMGRLDEDGFLFIAERKKDLIIRGGLNVYPRDVEEVLYEHPAVMECAVVGVPDDRLGEEVAAHVVLRPNAAATEDELIALCRERLAKYKVPKTIRFADALPKNPVGKILKRDLRAAAEPRS